MWEQVGVTAAAVRGPRGGTPLPMLCSSSGAGLWQCLSSQGPGHEAVGTSPSL